MIFTSIVHIAGPMIDGVQHCTRCQKILINYRGAMVMVMPGDPPPHMSGWEDGGYVAECGNQSSAQDHDAEADDEMACYPLPVETQ